MNAQQTLIYTDLDGSLLDHHTYSHADADAVLYELQQQHIPVIPTTSKTRAELEPLRHDLQNTHPFIVENGAAIYIPTGYFPMMPEHCQRIGDYWVYAPVQSRNHWLQYLNEIATEFKNEFTHFQREGTHGIMRLTGLSETSASQANDREYSEPILWLGNPQRRTAFIKRLQQGGAHALQGGRFITLSGQCDKGVALHWLTQQYQRHCDKPYNTMAIGDSANDVAMLEMADIAVIIRSPVHQPATIQTQYSHTQPSNKTPPHQHR